MNKIAVEGENRKEKGSFVNGTNDREAYPKRWIAVLVQVNCEKKTATRLGKVGYETYIPTQHHRTGIGAQPLSRKYQSHLLPY